MNRNCKCYPPGCGVIVARQLVLIWFNRPEDGMNLD
jgi:hypothetical protein